jgi:hypothetical protein
MEMRKLAKACQPLEASIRILVLTRFALLCSTALAVVSRLLICIRANAGTLTL